MNFDAFIKAALAEDIGNGDHTSLACIPAGTSGKAKLLVKEDGILAGVDLAENIFRVVNPGLRFERMINDGETVKSGMIAFEVSGNEQAIVTAERLVLNCMQRMSGIATMTAEFVKQLEGLKTKVLDTRKTTPLFREMEKWAVRIGGGGNHRMGLYDMILIKDNHVDYAGGIKNAIRNVNDYLKNTNLDIKVEIETRNRKEIEEVLENGGVHRIMLDNFTPAELKEAIHLINRRYETEASGGITLETIRPYAESGVDFISVGALTHSVNSLDLSLKAVK